MLIGEESTATIPKSDRPLPGPQPFMLAAGQKNQTKSPRLTDIFSENPVAANRRFAEKIIAMKRWAQRGVCADSWALAPDLYRMPVAFTLQ